MDSRITTTTAIMQSLGSDQRRILSRWRALIYLRRASSEYTPDERRWVRVPQSESDIQSTLNNLFTSQRIESIPHAPNCFATRDSFGRRYPLGELELLFELNPYTILTHYSALEHHSFTIDQPKVISAWGESGFGLIPLGTKEEEWQGLDLPVAHRPKKVISQRVDWFRGKMDISFGIETVQSGQVPVRVTTPERTLVESLQHPDRSGGIANVLRSWQRAEDFVDPDQIVTTTEKFGINLLRQRVGYVAESVGLMHPAFDEWAARSKRGGSSKLVGGNPFSSEFDSRWNLSLNGPVEILMR